MAQIKRLDYPLINEGGRVFGATFMRHGGISGGAYSSLNVSGTVGDHPACVKSNREKVREVSGFSTLCFMKQVHGDRIIEVGKDYQAQECDALFTMERDTGLTVMHADCQAALFFDPIKKAVAAVHAGWRGQMINIYAKTLAFFKQRAGSNPAEIVVCISPSLGPDHAKFDNFEKDIPLEYQDFRKADNYLDLWQLAKAQLVVAGLREKNVHIAGICTACHIDDYYSFRREKITGRNATVIGLRT